MLSGVDLKMGKMMLDESIIDNFIMFLVVGYEMIVGILLFMMYNFLKNFEIYCKV